MAEGKPLMDGRTPPASGCAIDSQQLLDALPVPVCVIGPHGQLLGHNRLAANLWPSELEASLSGGLPFDPYHACARPDGATMADTPQSTVWRTGVEIRDLPLVMQVPEGRPLRLMATCSPMLDAQGRMAATINSFRAAADTHDHPGDFDAAGLALQRIGHDGTIHDANQAALDQLGYQREDYVGRHVSEFQLDPRATEGMFATLQAGQPLDRFPLRLKARDGSARHLELSSGGTPAPAGGHWCLCSVDVTEQHRRNELFQVREWCTREMLHALPIAVFTCDADGGITFYNEAAVELAGKRPALGDPWAETWKPFHPDGSPMAYEHSPLATALREKRPLHGMEVIAERPDGRRISCLAHPTPLFNDQGQLIGAVNMLMDVTQRKQAEQALQELNETLEERVAERTRAAESAVRQLRSSERRFSLLVGGVTDYAIYMLDLDGKVSNWNAGAERIKGYRAEEVIGRHFGLFYTPEDRAAGLPQTALAHARRDGRWEAEGWRLRKDGTRFWANAVVDAIYDGGRLIGFAKITRDITERKAAELQRIESEQRSRGVIDTALDGFVQVDAQGCVVEWNPRAAAMFGWSRNEAIGRPLSSLVVTADDHAHPLGLMTRPIDAGGGAWREVAVLRRDGSRITVELSISTLHLASGDLLNVFVRDLTEKILIDAKLRQAQKMEAVGQLTGGIAHDFNNLLQGIIGSLELIRWRIEQQQTTELDRHIDGAVGSAKRAAAMIHRLLAFSRRQPLDPRPVQVNPLIASMEELLARTIGEQVELVLDLAPELWETLCDPNQLESALLNLSINARDAMPSGGRLTVSARNMAPGPDDHAERVCIEVADTGTGMPADVVERAFDPFFTTKPSGQGTGLGLSMVYGFAHQSNGRCEIDSTPGAGTCVRLLLPRHHPRPGAPAADQPSPAQPRAGRGEVVLVVEDDPVVRSVVVDVLHQLDYRTLQASDGMTGLDILRSAAELDLLVSDIGLPGINGRQMAELARLARPQLKVLLMTGYAESATEPDGFLGPGMEMITKPFDNATLAARIRAMVRGG